MSNDDDQEFHTALATTLELAVLVGRLRSLKRRGEEEGAFNLAMMNLADLLDQSRKKCKAVYRENLDAKRAKLADGS